MSLHPVKKGPQTQRSTRTFTDLDKLLAAVGDLKHIDYRLTVNGIQDPENRRAYARTELKVALQSSGFESGRDQAVVWLP